MEKQRRDLDAQVDEILREVAEYKKRQAIQKIPVFDDLTPSHYKKPPLRKHPMPLIRYLVYLLIVTTAITGVSLSRYATSSGVNDSARVAKFDVVISHVVWSEDENNDISLVSAPGGTRNYVFTTQNNSEVAVRARLIIVSSDYIATENPTGWTDIAPHGSENITVTVTGTFEGNHVKVYIEYEQID